MSGSLRGSPRSAVLAEHTVCGCSWSQDFCMGQGLEDLAVKQLAMLWAKAIFCLSGTAFKSVTAFPVRLMMFVWLLANPSSVSLLQLVCMHPSFLAVVTERQCTGLESEVIALEVVGAGHEAERAKGSVCSMHVPPQELPAESGNGKHRVMPETVLFFFPQNLLCDDSSSSVCTSHCWEQGWWCAQWSV